MFVQLMLILLIADDDSSLMRTLTSTMTKTAMTNDDDNNDGENDDVGDDEDDGGDYEDDEHDCDGDQLIGSISRFTGWNIFQKHRRDCIFLIWQNPDLQELLISAFWREQFWILKLMIAHFMSRLSGDYCEDSGKWKI